MNEILQGRVIVDTGYPEPITTETRFDKPTEDKFLIRAREGEDQAFNVLHLVSEDRVYKYAVRRVYISEDAEDITQNVFLNAYRAIGRYNISPSPYIAYLFTIAHNALITFKRGYKDLLVINEGMLVHGNYKEDPANLIDSKFDQEKIKGALAKLETVKPEQARILKLRFYGNLSHLEIAEVIGKTGGAIRAMQDRAFKGLRKILEEDSIQII